MSETNGRIDYRRLVRDIDYASAVEGTRFEQYTGDTEGGLGSVLGGWLGAILGRFVGMALGQVAQELLVDELFGGEEDTEPAVEAEGGETGAGETADEGGDTSVDSDADSPEADAE
ncbi:hypothetical protein [Halohasta salina]|uniref:hypothetical protein n=1 Tax=Halohasta salina TaxID=2961621 RepID=UPI0020A60934|nr:hypothetical protein [Halohasta salina]